MYAKSPAIGIKLAIRLLSPERAKAIKKPLKPVFE